MIREIEIEGFKSIERLKLELGRVTVLIGENGCGKSNILEAIAFASAAYARRLDHEFLAPRGIRNVEPRLMRPAFSSAPAAQMRLLIRDDTKNPVSILISDTSTTVPSWSAKVSVEPDDREIRSLVDDIIEADQGRLVHDRTTLERHIAETWRFRDVGGLSRFLVFSPENSALRTFQREGQLLPIGINGEGLFAHLKALVHAGMSPIIDELNRRLTLIDWFSSFEIPADLAPGEQRLSIRDRYLPADVLLDQRCANEGFLFLLFYYTLLLSPDTPTFFAIDNIDASLNPRLCARLMSDVVALAKQQDRQVVVTTHNPAVLDGLNLADDEQRLVVVSRTQRGTTRARRVPVSRPIEGAPPLRLSEAFIQGYLGGLPSNF